MRRLTSALVLFLIAVPALAGRSNFSVSPTEANLSADKSSALIVLKNASVKPLRFEINVFTWSEDERGQMTLAPTTDVTLFPKLVDLGPGASRNIRIGLGTGVVGDSERSYRLFVEELPDQTTAAPNAVAIRTKVGIPVFVRPVKPSRSATVESVTVEGGKVLTRVRNTGNLHLSVDGVTVRGTNASGAQTFSGEAKGWYVLPGATRVFELPVANTACAATTSVSVEVTGHGKSLPGNGAVPAGACTAR